MVNGIFKDDVKYGLKYELRTHQHIKDKYNYEIIKISQGNSPKYDFKALDRINDKKIKYEVKTTRKEYTTVFIEYENSFGKPSGINKTEAHKYIFVDVSYDEDNNENYYMIDIILLKAIIIKHTIKHTINKFKGDKGYIINKDIIIASSVQL
jgi:hypothetical protein